MDASTITQMTRGLRQFAITENYLKEKFVAHAFYGKSDIRTKRLDYPLFNHLTYPLADRSLRPIMQCDKTEKESIKTKK